MPFLPLSLHEICFDPSLSHQTPSEISFLEITGPPSHPSTKLLLTDVSASFELLTINLITQPTWVLIDVEIDDLDQESAS